jgi:hypothetical protein
MTNHSFLLISDIVLHPVFKTLLNLLMFASINMISYQICKLKLSINILNMICVNVLILFFIISFFQVIYFFSIYPNILGKIFSYLIFILGLISFLYSKFSLKKIRFNFKKSYLYIYIFLLFYFLISISAVTDIDSIDYHLGVPLEWYRNESFNARYDWLHYRGASLGEILNLFGLHFGSDNFGQLIQFFSLLLVLLSSKKFLNEKNFFFFSVIILGCPVLIFLTSTQKHQLFASSLIYFSILLSLEINKNFNKFYLATILFILSFCITIKVNYLIPSFFIFIFCFYTAIKKFKFLYILSFSIISFFIIAFPHFYKNFLYYGDPLTPLLENYKKIPDPIILEFARLEKNFAFEQNDNFLSKFLKLFFTNDPGKISRVLGLGFIGIFLIRFNKLSYDQKIIYLVSIIIFMIYLLTFIGMGRYYLDIFFSLSLILALNYEKLRLNKFFNFLLICQSFFVFLCIIYGAYFLSPSAILNSKNIEIQKIAAEGYDLFQKVDIILPEKSKLFINNSRSYSFVPREFISNKYFKTAKSLNLEKNPDNIIKDNKVTHIISKNKDYQSECIYKGYKYKISTNRSSRNPFNNRQEVIFYIHEVDKKKC